MLKDSIKQLLNLRIKEEVKSSMLYLSMSNWLEDKGYIGAAKLWKKYSDEEMTHADKARKFMLERDVIPTVPSIEEMPVEYESCHSIVQKSYEHEMLVSEQCRQLAIESLREGDIMTYGLAQWYVNEQVEEEDKLKTILDRVKLAEGDYGAILLIDHEMLNGMLG